MATAASSFNGIAGVAVDLNPACNAPVHSVATNGTGLSHSNLATGVVVVVKPTCSRSSTGLYGGISILVFDEPTPPITTATFITPTTTYYLNHAKP